MLYCDLNIVVLLVPVQETGLWHKTSCFHLLVVFFGMFPLYTLDPLTVPKLTKGTIDCLEKFGCGGVCEKRISLPPSKYCIHRHDYVLWQALQPF